MIGPHKDAFINGRLTGRNVHKVGKMVRVNVSDNIQVVSDVLKHDEVWACSLAGDGRAPKVVSFFHACISVCVVGRLLNIHLIVVPFWDQNTAVRICKMICRLFDQLCGYWRKKLL